MPGIGGRFGWNEPPPAATTITLVSNTVPASVVTRNIGSPMLLERLHHLVEMERRLERLDLLHQLVGEPLPGDDREAAGMS